MSKTTKILSIIIILTIIILPQEGLDDIGSDTHYVNYDSVAAIAQAA